MSIKQFAANIEKEPGWGDALLVECAEFLILPEQQNRESWKCFSDKFFKRYQAPILRHWGYQPDILKIVRYKVLDKVFFMAVMSALFHSHILSTSVNEFSDIIFRTADTGYKLSTIRRMLSDGCDEFEFVLEFINEYEKYRIRR